jgi:hypothetical protein
VSIGGIIEALGLGAAREARLLVARLPRAGMLVATLDEPVAKALERAGHRLASVETGGADAALALPLPAPGDGHDATDALERLARLMRATQPGGEVIVAGGEDRARDAGVLLRAGLTALRQDEDGGSLFTTGLVPRPTL